MAKLPLSLLIEQGPKSGHRLQCKPRGRVTIGRARANTLQISKDVGISQKHLAFFWVSSPQEDDAGWSVTDLGSSNGTLLNNLQIEPNVPISIKARDLIKIGAETTIRVVIPSSTLEISEEVALLKCKDDSKHTDSHANGTSISEEHHKTRTHVSSEINVKLLGKEDHSRCIHLAEDNHYKDGPVSVEHLRGTSKERVFDEGGQEPDKSPSIMHASLQDMD